MWVLICVFPQFTCSLEKKSREHAATDGGTELSSISPDIIIENFKFQEVSLGGVEVEFHAVQANYYQSVDFFTFEEVEGVLSRDATPYYFMLPEAMYDRGMKSLISNGEITITADRLFHLTGMGGIFDFERHEASLDRNVVLQSGSVHVEGERGVLNITDESFRLKKVEATVIDPEGFQKELGEVVK